MSKKKIRSSYLYADGHAVIIYEKEDKDAGTVEFVEVHEKWTNARLGFKGRLTFGQFEQEMLHLAKRAYAIEAKEPRTDYGSENTKRMGIAVGYLTYEMRPGGYGSSLHWTTMPGVISAGFTYQPEVQEDCPTVEDRKWGAYPIGKFHRQPIQAVAKESGVAA